MIKDIMRSKVFSRRHNIFYGPSPRARADLVWQVRTHLFSKEQIDIITDILITQYCPGKSLNVNVKLNTTCTKIYI